MTIVPDDLRICVWKPAWKESFPYLQAVIVLTHRQCIAKYWWKESKLWVKYRNIKFDFMEYEYNW